MRTPFLLLPVTLALSAPLSGMTQDAPRVLFCAGECFAVDAKGIRTRAPKGTSLLPGQRLETGAGGYAQVKLSPEAAVGIGDQARVRFDRHAVLLDQGRVRLVGGEAFGKPITTPIELRTTDGIIVLRNADLEAKKTGLGTTATPTVVKLNTGDARLGNGPGEIQLPTQAVRGIERGKLAGAPIPVSEILPPKREMNAPVAGGPVTTLPTAPVAISTPLIQPTTTLVLSPTLTTSLSTYTLSTSTVSTTSLITTSLSTSNYYPVLTSADQLLKSTMTTTSGAPQTFEASLINLSNTTVSSGSLLTGISGGTLSGSTSLSSTDPTKDYSLNTDLSGSSLNISLKSLSTKSLTGF